MLEEKYQKGCYGTFWVNNKRRNKYEEEIIMLYYIICENTL